MWNESLPKLGKIVFMLALSFLGIAVSRHKIGIATISTKQQYPHSSFDIQLVQLLV